MEFTLAHTHAEMYVQQTVCPLTVPSHSHALVYTSSVQRASVPACEHTSAWKAP